MPGRLGERYRLVLLAQTYSIFVERVLDRERFPLVDGVETGSEGIVFTEVNLAVVAFLPARGGRPG